MVEPDLKGYVADLITRNPERDVIEEEIGLLVGKYLMKSIAVPRKELVARIMLWLARFKLPLALQWLLPVQWRPWAKR